MVQRLGVLSISLLMLLPFTMQAETLPFWLKNVAPWFDKETKSSVEYAARFIQNCTGEGTTKTKDYTVGICVKNSEYLCERGLRNPIEKMACYEALHYWWYFQSYPEYNPVYSLHEGLRIRKLQMLHEPTNLELIFDASNKIYSIEVREILNKEREDFSDDLIQFLRSAERENGKDYLFYIHTLFALRSLVRHELASVDAKEIYFKEFKRALALAEKWWRPAPKYLLTVNYVRFVETHLASHREFAKTIGDKILLVSDQ